MTINLPDGSEVAEIVLPDGSTASEVIAPDGSVVFQSIAIPDSVDYQYPFSTFTTSTWSDNVGGADMTVNNLTASTFSNGEDSVSGDGADDYGTVSGGPRNLPSNETFGVALTLQYPTPSPGDTVFGALDSADNNNRFRIYNEQFYDSSAGELAFEVGDDAGNRLVVETDNVYDDGNPHAVVINKTGNTAGDISIYVDDMSAAAASSIREDGTFDHTNFSPGTDTLAFFAREQSGIQNYMEMHAGIFEFNTAPYTQTEREDFVGRRPEV